MLTSSIVYDPLHKLPTKEFEDGLTTAFNKCESKLGNILTASSKPLDFDTRYIINHACIWNSPENIGEKVALVAYNEKLAFVIGNNKFVGSTFYRHEDLTPIYRPISN